MSWLTRSGASACTKWLAWRIRSTRTRTYTVATLISEPGGLLLHHPWDANCCLSPRSVRRSVHRLAVPTVGRHSGRPTVGSDWR
jgi:hypothetical protein